jgi:hypothetical protein
LANLSDGTNVGNDFTSTVKTVNLATTPSTQGNLTITVTVTDTSTSTVMGTATAVYSASAQQDYANALQPFGPTGFYPQGGGHAIVYVSIPLIGSQQTKHISFIHDVMGSASYNIHLPAASTPISPTSVVTAGQLFGGTAGQVNGTITNLTYQPADGYTTEIVGQSTVWWNYGDTAWLVIAIRDWDNRGSNSGAEGNGGDALQTAKGFATKAHVVVT